MPSSSDNSEFDELCGEAHRNAKDDRKALKSHLKVLTKIAEDSDAGTETMLLITDAIAKTSEAISKANTQIIQIAQLKLKRTKATESDDGFDDADTQDVYDAISSSIEEKPEEPN